MTRIVWTVQPLNDGYQGFLKVDSGLLHESNRAWFSVSEDWFFVGTCGANGRPGRRLPAGCENSRKIP